MFGIGAVTTSPAPDDETLGFRQGLSLGWKADGPLVGLGAQMPQA